MLPCRRFTTVRQTFLKLVFSVALLAMPVIAQACPNCKDGVAHYDAAYGRAGTSANGLQKGFNYSVILMLTVPLGMIGSGGLYIRKLAKDGRLPEF